MENDKLYDALLKEHAKHGSADDEAFLKDLNNRMEGKEKLVDLPMKKQSAGTRWLVSSGIAASVVFGLGVSYFWTKPEENAVAKNDSARLVALSTREELTSDEPKVSKMSKPPAPNSSVAKVIAASSVSPTTVPMPEVAVLESVADFGVADSFGEGWNNSLAPSQRKLLSKKKMSSRRQVERADVIAIFPPPSGRPPHNGLDVSNEKYGQLTDNKWTAPIDERSSLSTFAVDVDTASYANIRRMINQGQAVAKDSVRIEEMLNYFDYQYDQPKDAHPFAVHVDSCVSPWDSNNRIVRIGLQGKEIIREQRPATNLVFLLDVSGSMSSQAKLPLLKESMKYLLEELNEDDTVSIVVYAGASGLALPATKMDDEGRQKVLDKMQSLSAGGSTAGGQGIKLAYKVAKENFKKDGVNRIILATDGDFNVGVSDNASLTKMVKEKAKDGTYISVLGFGSGNINDAMLESITNNGNGNYNYIDTIKEGRKVLLEDMMGTMVTIAKDVKVQVEMNPNKVKAYRLIGYANRMLPPEAFLDKKVDAGEIGAGHTVTALYEIIPADGKPFGNQIDASRYFEKVEKKPNKQLKDSKEMLFVKLAYKQPKQKIEDESTYLTVPFTDKKSEVSADTQFATSVALFGMQLRDSEYKGKGDLSMVLDLAKKGKGDDGKGQRAEFIQLVEKLTAKE